MPEKTGQLDSSDFLSLLGLDDVGNTPTEQPDDDQWLMDTIGAMTLLRQLGAMGQPSQPVLDPPLDADAVPDCVRDLLNLIKKSALPQN